MSRLRFGRAKSRRIWPRVVWSIAGLLVIVATVVVGGGWLALQAALPTLDGVHAIASFAPGVHEAEGGSSTKEAKGAGAIGAKVANVPPSWTGLSTRAAIVRDQAGTVTVQAATRNDAAFATGYAHAQDRFFQMDLMRRLAAGELSALFGSQALRVDQQNRMHRFRARARLAVAALSPEQRGLLEAYADGVNAGLASLSARPFEYWVLRAKPMAWQAEDSMLALYAMYLDLQSGEMRRILSRGVLSQQVSPEIAAFLLPRTSHWDAPLDRDASAPAAVEPAIPADRPGWLDASTDSHDPGALADLDWRTSIGSNNFVVSGERSVRGAGMVANDMHLGLSLPDIWYRLSLEVGTNGGQPARRIVGVSLPGAPLIVVGSNGLVAWGFTNSYGHYLDLVEVQVDPDHPARYRAAMSPVQERPTFTEGAERRSLSRMDAGVARSTAQGASAASPTSADTMATARSTISGDWQAAIPYEERIEVKGGETVTQTIYETRWGPEWRVAGHVYAVRWVAYDPQAANLTLREMEGAADLAAAMNVAQRSGVPTQNIVIADRAGHIGWTLAGPLPRRTGTSTSTGTSTGTGTNIGTSIDGLPVAASSYVPWNGYLTPAEYPLRVDPPSGALWTANSRQLDGPDQQKIGDGGADLGARATQIRDDLAAQPRFEERDLLAIELDDRAKALAFWRTVLLNELDPMALADHPERAELRQLVEQWNARASADAVGYTLVRDFQSAMYESWFGALDARLAGIDNRLGYRYASSRYEAVMETLAGAHAWIPKRFGNWHAFVLDRADQVIARNTHDEAKLSEARWGMRNQALIAHPFARMMPAPLAKLLSAPYDPLPGDINMPRVQGRMFGASERMVVAPGHESHGIMELPGGASGNPLSPFFLAGHENWVQGRASPLMAGAEAHRLVLEPAQR